MWGWRKRGSDRVDCVACGTTVDRPSAREYDKEGDRWSRSGKEFEYVCKACHRDLCHQPRAELEALLVDIARHGRLNQEEFLRRYEEQVVERYGPLESK
ncbi:DUF7562 family protein [Halomarina rubra]|uniref:Small CPxCG-related zinc finger protein n=1 Tax=Halomarina rubra TaxID=2071873 RepID=A0ABD6AQI1_9EURY|nr:hypothetical protein [Halomarina rubra]